MVSLSCWICVNLDIFDDRNGLLEAMEEWDESMSHPTTVVLTASHDESIRNRCSELHVHDYINKPVHEREFMRVVRDHKKLMIHSTPMLTMT